MDSKKVNELLKIGKDMQVLYVEDDENARNAMLLVLNDIFPHVTVGIDGLDGLEKFKAGKYDFVMTDINMPKMNGIEMIDGIREISEKVPVLILSASNEADIFTKTIKLGIDGYLLKPVDMPQLIEVLYKTTQYIKLSQESETYKLGLEDKIEERTKQLLHQSTHDLLTNKKNNVALENAITSTPDGTLFLVDIDSLRNFNELYGMDTGSYILIAFSDLLDSFSQNRSYEIYRVYGGTFALYSTKKDIDYKKDLEELSTLVRKFSIFIPALDESLDVDGTVALVMKEKHLIEKAEMAMKYAKENRKHYSIYDTAVHSSENVKNELYWRSIIKESVRNDNIVPVFQPILNRDKQANKYEVLMRLIQNEQGEEKLISPFYFLETAKRTKQYHELTEIIIDKSFKIMKEYDLDFSINLSFEDIKDKSCSLVLEEYITKYKLGKHLILEIVESEYIQDFEMVQNFIASFRKLGVRIAIDDFGSGYSNFSHVIALKPDFLKIDGSLIKDITTSPESLILVKAITSFSKDLNIKVIAEYVSSKEIFEILFDLGVDEFQGFYFSEPIRNPRKDNSYA